MRKRIHSGAVLGVLFSSILCGGTNVCAQENSVPDSTEENNTSSSYVTKDIEVAGEMKDPFGNVMTEQSYYRTGGDVDVIDRDMLEKRHYDQLSDALRQVPGVQIKTPGYRGGEYGYTQTHNIVTINGDDRVVVLVDGRRMDNSVGNVVSGRSTSGSKAVTDINQVTNIDNIEKIEVIKGPGASFYGSDATGGVINIITRKGTDQSHGSLDLSTGSWNRHNYKLNYAGSTAQGKLKYFFSLGREMGGDAKYKDGLSGNTYTYVNTGYKEENLNLRVDYDFDPTHSLRAAFNHMQSDADYPLTAPDHKYFNAADWNRIKNDYFHHDKYGDIKNPGYRTLWYMWAVTGAYNAYNKNNFDLNHSAKNPVRIEFTQVPRRSLVYEVNTLETLLAFGQGAKILSASLNTSGETYERLKEKYPEELEKIAHISTQEISREMAIAYQPDFILGWKSTFSPKRYGSTAWWKVRGVNTYIVATSNHVLKHGTIEDECQFLDDMGRIFDVPGTSAALIGEIHAEMDLVGQNTAGKRKQDVMVVEVSKTGIMNYDDGWIVGDMVRHLGGNMPVKSRSVGAEDMLAQDPDVIFVVCFNTRHREESERFFQQVRFNSLKAFQNHRIYMLPFQYMYTPAVNTLNGIRAIKKGLYPEL